MSRPPLELLEYGFRLLPLRPSGKEPLLAHGFKDASCDLRLIGSWAQRWPDANWGAVPPPDKVVVDVDAAEGFDELDARGWSLPSTATVKTGRGRHYYYSTETPVSPRTHISPHVDIRGPGSYCVAPPSTHENGTSYVWERPLADLAPAPPWLVGLGDRSTTDKGGDLAVDPTAEAPARLGELLADPRARATWDRNRPDLRDQSPSGYCMALADATVAAGWSDAEVVALLAAWRRKEGADPKPDLWYARTLATAKAGATADRDYLYTDGGNAQRFADEHRDRVRYCWEWGKWLAWDGRRWAVDRGAAVRELAKVTARAMLADAAKIDDPDRRKAATRWAMQTDSLRRLDAMLALAQSEPGIPVSPDELDRDPWLLNVANGTVDLRTGQLRPHERGSLFTKLSLITFDPEAACPLWETFLERVLPDADVRRYMQKAAGYALTGFTNEQVLFFLYGGGANGKSVFLALLLHLAGDYGTQAAPELLIATRGEQHPTALADLAGKRVVVTVEVEDGRRFAESILKWITGGDQLRARRMREDYWSFQPTHSIFLAANHRPGVRGTDLAVWRRLRLIPFTVTIPEAEQDPQLNEKLKGEASGILAWAVRGCLAWQREGLKAPRAVLAAVEDYRVDQDLVGRFLAERCMVIAGAEAKASTLYGAFTAWCSTVGEHHGSMQTFNRQLRDRGFESEQRRTGYHWRGLGLLTDERELGEPREPNSGFVSKTTLTWNKPENGFTGLTGFAGSGREPGSDDDRDDPSFGGEVTS